MHGVYGQRSATGSSFLDLYNRMVCHVCKRTFGWASNPSGRAKRTNHLEQVVFGGLFLPLKQVVGASRASFPAMKASIMPGARPNQEGES